MFPPKISLPYICMTNGFGSSAVCFVKLHFSHTILIRIVSATSTIFVFHFGDISSNKSSFYKELKNL